MFFVAVVVCFVFVLFCLTVCLLVCLLSPQASTLIKPFEIEGGCGGEMKQLSLRVCVGQGNNFVKMLHTYVWF